MDEIRLLDSFRFFVSSLTGFFSQPKYFRFSLKKQLLLPNWSIAQYFFTEDCARDLVYKLNRFANPCCLCTPMIGKIWQDMGRVVRILDIDERLNFLPGFKKFDITRPEPLSEIFDVIIVDPPLDLALEVVLDAVNMVTRKRYDTNLAILHETNTANSLFKHFEPYGLSPTYYSPVYCHVRKSARHQFMFYANFDISFGNNGGSEFGT